MNKWSSSSLEKLETCHVDLQILFNEVLPIHDCKILFGHRGEDLQNQLFEEGKSKLQYPKSKHNKDPSEAIDAMPVIPGINPYGTDPKPFAYFAGIVVATADWLYQDGAIEHKIMWGGNWSTKRDKRLASFYDAAHFEIYKG